MADLTPLMEQYGRIKGEYSEEILFFRLGDFYEMFDGDAILVSALLNLTLTARNGHPMCGIPYHAARSYICRLVKAGKKIAICEQLTPPGKGIIERKVVEIITPGTVLEEEFLNRSANNYLAAIARHEDFLAMCYLDVSTGEFVAASCVYEKRGEWLSREILKILPREILIQQSLLEDEVISPVIASSEASINRYPDWLFSMKASRERLQILFGTSSLKGFGFNDDDPSVVPAGVLLEYLERTSRLSLSHVTTLKKYVESGFVQIDESSQRNLEIVMNLHDGSTRYTLLESVDQTLTSGGARLLRKRLLFPERNKAEIETRLDQISYFLSHPPLISAIHDSLKGVQDLERLVSRLALDKVHARDMLSIASTCRHAVKIASSFDSELIPGRFAVERGLLERIQAFQAEKARAIHDETSVIFTEGKLIKTGFDARLDELRGLKENSRAILEQYVESVRKDSGIPSIKLKYNRMIGYFLELSRNASLQAPVWMIRRQSLSAGERYTTERLSELETEIGSCDEKIFELERILFFAVRDAAKSLIRDFLFIASFLSEIDFSLSGATIASQRAFSRPILQDDGMLEITEGRHPVVERTLTPGTFIPNDTRLDTAGVSFALITGPNMAGKSTFLRQTALIVLLAQAGYYVPATKARIGMTDRVFCRVGAQDNLARGESTFLVEMHETALILNAATAKSLVIMDEVGRGTGTVDGLSIAWAVTEHILSEIGCRTLFATHFHELTAIHDAKFANWSLETMDDGKTVIFLKRVVQGPAESSYGIHVAGLAGIPKPVLKRAKEIEVSLESGMSVQREIVVRHKPVESRELFTPEEMILTDISGLDENAITPLEALSRISGWKKLLKAGGGA